MKRPNEKLYDLIGILCGVFLVAVLIFCIVKGNQKPSAGEADAPDEAVTMQGTA